MSLFSVLIITSGLLPADITDYIMVAVTAMSVFCGGFICAKVNKSSGLICGLLTAAAVFVIITVIGLLQSEAVLTPLSLIKLGAMLICGCAGGVLGVNQKEKGIYKIKKCNFNDFKLFGSFCNNLPNNYKSLVDLFKCRGCGQSPQILFAYAI